MMKLTAESSNKHKVAPHDPHDESSTKASNLAENLRFLCSKKRSISEVCRGLNINRQQFNKYLSGASTPSSANMKKICNYFGCDHDLLYMSHSQFVDLFEQQSRQREEQIRSQKMLSLLETAFPVAVSDLDRYLGYYHVYHHSMGFPGYISKSLAHFYREEDRVWCKTIERMSKVDEGEGPRFTFKYFGAISLIADRLYLIEKESLLGKNLSLTVLYPSYQPKVQFLNGINAGVSSTRGRDPACRYITYEYLDKSINIRHALATCGLYRPDSDGISADIKERLTAKDSPDPNIFFGFNFS